MTSNWPSTVAEQARATRGCSSRRWRARNLAASGEPDLADLAAAYGFGIAGNHPFVDGNKRTALVAIELFLLLNGAELQATDAECVLTILDLAAGKLDEAELAAWIRARTVAC